MARTILVVDDDPKIVALVRAYLVNAGYDVVTARDGRQALEVAAACRPALVVLDLMLPEVDGMEVTRRLREAGDVPIVMLTARGATADRVRGLRQGADDYLPKPFAPSELVARVETVLRRVPAPAAPERRLRCADLEIDLERHEVRRAGTPLPLSLVEHRLLVALVEAGGRVLTRDQLIDAVSGRDAEGVLERSVDVYVGRLRARLGDAAGRPAYIATVRGVGYRLVAAPA
ncbi:MAG TPA: response regulator transcription factor [Candidatus Dormibacteraeota bacterium]|nr:response regulator transcription factor [Candidatus Dormibacteraeota bacterium]